MTNKTTKWQELSRKTVFQKYSRKVEKVVFRLPDGKESDFYIKKEGPAVAILALTKDNQVVLVKQFRPGPNEVLNELPGGYVEKDETPQQAAQRELLEETGFEGKIQFATEVLDCAYSTMKRHCVVITECEKVARQKLEPNEFAEVTLFSLKDFKSLLRSGKNTDVEIGFLGLDYLKLL